MALQSLCVQMTERFFIDVFKTKWVNLSRDLGLKHQTWGFRESQGALPDYVDQHLLSHNLQTLIYRLF